MTDLTQRWRDLFAMENMPPVRDMLAEDIQMHSPAMHQVQRGPDLIADYITAAHEIFTRWDLDYVRAFQNGNEICMEFEGEIEGVTLNGVDIIRWNADDKIDDFKIMIRPASGLKKLGEVMVKILAEVQAARAT